MYETQLSERQSHSGEGSSQQSTQQSDNNIYLEVVGGINKKGRILGLGSQAATIKAASKASPSISTDSVSSEEVAAMQAKIQELTAELQQKNLEQEMIKQKMEQWERRFERLMLDNNLKTSLQPEGEDDNENEEMGEDDMDNGTLP